MSDTYRLNNFYYRIDDHLDYGFILEMFGLYANDYPSEKRYLYSSRAFYKTEDECHAAAKEAVGRLFGTMMEVKKPR